MKLGRLARSLALAVSSVAVLSSGVIGSPEEQPLGGSASVDEIRSIIADLGDPSYEKRTFATRRLCAIGSGAREQLLAAAAGADVETSLRAKAVLSVLDRLMFDGVEVRLSFAKSKIAWDEPLDLVITLSNHSEYPARVPFEIGNGRSTATEPARQVGDLLDAADFLLVQHENGERIELIVDDIAADSEVAAAVQRRVNEGLSGALAPGGRMARTVRAFNRGWARYPLLKAGTYTVVLDYVPEWGDETLAAQRVGRVVSNRATLTVTRGAPETVIGGGPEASVQVRRDGKFVVALLTNRADQSLLVNVNFGRSPPFAEGRWVLEIDGLSRDLPVVPDGSASWHDFDTSSFVEAAPGQVIELARIRIDELRAALARENVGPDRNPWTVYFGYANLCDRQWQARQGPALLENPKAPEVLQTVLPRRILAARHSSNRLVVVDEKPER